MESKVAKKVVTFPCPKKLTLKTHCWKKDGRSHIRFTVKFFLHFFGVMLVMYCGAVVFAVLEDPDVMFPSSSTTEQSNIQQNITLRSDTYNVKNSTESNSTLFGNIMKNKYNISMSLDLQEKFEEDMRLYFSSKLNASLVSHEDATTTDDHEPATRHYVIMKWFYFVTISTTTIGYGDVTPKTDKGRLFYIFFSVVGIALMMSLLKSCGCILTGLNKQVYHVIKRHVFRTHDVVSDELMSVLLMTSFFFLFMLLVVWHDQKIAEVKGESRIDCFYFWIVTFTTVGFGDVILPLHVEMDHVYEMLFYRLFGLSFLAGIIESIQSYIKYRNKVIARKSTKRFTQIKHRLLDLHKKEAPNFFNV